MKVQIFPDELYPHYVLCKEGECTYDSESPSLEMDDSLIERIDRVYKEFYELRDELKEWYRQQENQVEG